MPVAQITLAVCSPKSVIQLWHARPSGSRWTPQQWRRSVLVQMITVPVHAQLTSGVKRAREECARRHPYLLYVIIGRQYCTGYRILAGNRIITGNRIKWRFGSLGAISNQIGSNFGNILYIYSSFLDKSPKGACILLRKIYGKNTWFHRIGLAVRSVNRKGIRGILLAGIITSTW